MRALVWPLRKDGVPLPQVPARAPVEGELSYEENGSLGYTLKLYDKISQNTLLPNLARVQLVSFTPDKKLVMSGFEGDGPTGMGPLYLQQWLIQPLGLSEVVINTWEKSAKVVTPKPEAPVAAVSQQVKLDASVPLEAPEPVTVAASALPEGSGALVETEPGSGALVQAKPEPDISAALAEVGPGAVALTPVKRRGRPPGSKNKPKGSETITAEIIS